MVDNFGNDQNRVVEVKDRNLDNVIFQYRHPPLTSEWNLINQIGNEKIQNLSKMSLPSGWLKVDDIIQGAEEATSRTGSVICSESYTATTFKLMSWGNNYAIVNGWPILVQGYGPASTLNDNVIRMDAEENQYNNFVFLEVWRKLVGPSDPLYRYGNVDRPYSDNEIEWDVVGCETTKRVQIQYRIRSVKVSSLSDCTNEIFDDNVIHPIGGRTAEAVLRSFGQYGSSDPGLYIVGDGSDSDKEYFNTVDGYVYAIPMFVAYRRNLSESGFIPTSMSRTAVNKASKFRSDRPDNKIADIIYKDDLIDMRHQVMVSNDIKNVVDTTISKLMSGDLSTALKKGFGEDGALNDSYSGASTIMKLERINSASGDNIPDIGNGSGTGAAIFKRRAFSNAEVTHDHNIVKITDTAPGVHTIASQVTLPPGEIISVDGFYTHAQGSVSGVAVDVSYTCITITASAVITGDLFMEFTFKYDSSSYGFKDVPKEFVEVNKNNTLVIATRDNDVLLRYNKEGDLLNFSASSGEIGYPDDISVTDKVHFCGGNYTELSEFGHELVLTRTAINGIITLTLTNYKYNQNYILGVKSVMVDSDLETFSVNLINSSCIVTISSLISTPSKSVKLRLYTGSSFNPYSEAQSFKFFDLSKQGKGITDTYEMIMVPASLSGGKYLIDTGDKPIIKIATTSLEVGGVVEGTPFIINASGDKVAVASTINDSLPVLDDSVYTEDLLPTRINVELSGVTGDILVPVLVHSYVAVNEDPYNFYYDAVPYQGLLNTTANSIYGKIIGESSAAISSSGSGSIVNYSYNDGTASFIASSRTVTGVGTLWASFVNVGDYIRKAEASHYYRIIGISDTALVLAEKYAGSTESGSSYEILRLDIPNSIISNVVDRLPALSVVSTENITDYSCYSDSMSAASDSGSIILTSAKRKLQDPLNALTNDFMLGSSTAKRGRSNFEMTLGENSIFKLSGGRPYIDYADIYGIPTGHNKKVYQFYLFTRSGKDYQSSSNLMGRVYLMVVAGETVNATKNYLNPFSDKDVVDIFELVGRPIIRG